MNSLASGNRAARLEFDIARVSGGEETKAAKIFTGIGCGYRHTSEGGQGDRQGARDQRGAHRADEARPQVQREFEIKDWTDAKKPRKITTDELTSLRVPGKLAIQVGKVDSEAAERDRREHR